MPEIKALTLGWSLVFISALLLALSVGWGMPWFIFVIWGLNLAYGVYLLVKSFMEHQKPNIPAYIQHYRDQFELSMMAHPVPVKKTEKE
jgi:flagellar biosynthesis component FlhA